MINDTTLFSERRAALYLGITRPYLAQLRERGLGPRATEGHEGGVSYTLRDLKRYLAAHPRQPQRRAPGR